MKLSLAISLSLLGHGIILMPWSGTTEFAVNSTASSFQVALLQPEMNNLTTKQIKTESENKLPTPPVAEKKAHTEPNKVSHIQQHSEPSKKNNSEARAYVISQITQEMTNHFRYPLLARRNGWQGKVELALLVEADGSIDNVHIKIGSGYLILDQSALNALKKIKQIRHMESWLNFHNQEIIIPVIYHLHEG